jgi:CBS domain-containing protein
MPAIRREGAAGPIVESRNNGDSIVLRAQISASRISCASGATTTGTRGGTTFASPAVMNRADLKASDLMTTAVITIKAGEAISHADSEMRLASIRHLPVVDDRNHLVGILSHRDLLRAFARAKKETVHVADCMSRDVKTIRAAAPARKAAAIMLEHKIGSLPVIGDDGQLVGLITETDFLRLVYELLGGKSVM